jgi:PIN domain nuclease of toxin-antitoxin system
MKAYLLDTQPLLLRATGQSAKIGPRARRVFSAHEAGTATLHVTSVSLLELWLAERKGRLGSSESLGLLQARLESAGFVIEPMQPADVMTARALPWDHTDAFDRIIVATALRLNVPLLTGDRAIRDWNGVETLW